MFKILFTLALSCCAFAGMAQTGTVRGTITDGETGEELIGATIMIPATGKGVVTDFEGNYSLSEVAPGTYDLQVSYVSYQKKTITDVVVKPGEVTVLNIGLMSDTRQLEEIVVTAEVIKTSEAALLTVKKKSANLLDGISAQSIRAIGDSHAASALKRVPGVSVQGGKYVYVRGLGDRYTKTILNGMSVPGLDPDRNSLQMDIFPTSLIDNIIIYKAFTADLPADFTGGVVNIETKDFPLEKTIRFSASVGYNPDMHFNSDYLSYEGSGTDFLGFDNGSRNLPIGADTKIPNTAVGDPLTTELTQKFNSSLAAQRTSSPMDFSLGITAGNQIEREKATWGYNISGSYKNSTEYFDEVEYSTYVKPDQLELSELRPNRIQMGSYGSNNVLVSGLAGGALKTSRSKYRIILMHLQNGQSQAGIFSQNNFVSGSNSLLKDNLEYSERSITNSLLSGKHFSKNAAWEVEWKLSSTLSKIEDKDVRVTPFLVEDGNFSIDPSESGDPTRIWRNLEETNHAATVDLQREYKLFAYPSKLKFGTGITTKERSFGIFNYRLKVEGQHKLNLTGDADELLLPENIWTPEKDYGTSIAGNYEVSNTYEASLYNLAFYVSNEFHLAERLKAILGVRAEQYVQYYSGMNQQYAAGDVKSGTLYDDEEVLDLFDLFPSANFIYNLTEASNLRATYYRTTARPSFKEMSIAQIYDPITGRTFIGGLVTDPVFNPEPLKESVIDNFDVRWEQFGGMGQTVSFSAFYKSFMDPIELVTFSESAPDNFQPRNMGDAIVYGVELEARRNLGFVSPAMENFFINGNISLIESRLQMDKRPNGEYESRKNNARIGEAVKDTRQMQGQAPYLINGGLSYAGRNNGLEAGIYYNVQGKKLAIVGVAGTADVYDMPFHSLNLSVGKRFGSDERSQLSLKVENLLGSKTVQEYESFGSLNQTFSSLSPGRAISLSFGYSL